MPDGEKVKFWQVDLPRRTREAQGFAENSRFTHTKATFSRAVTLVNRITWRTSVRRNRSFIVAHLLGQ
jgi:hypothetical protein